MDKIAVLGSEGTFSDSASNAYSKLHQLPLKEVFYHTFEDTFKAIGSECEYGILPIENSLDGYVQRSLDLLMECEENGVRIIDEITVPVQFSLVANNADFSGIKRLFVQFKANGQCRKLISSLPQTIRIVETENNVESYEKVKNGGEGDAAIIPHHLFLETHFQFGIENVTDYSNNFTRFFILHKENKSIFDIQAEKGTIKSALYFLPKEDDDKPGILYEFLREFSSRKINLVSIMSRPTKVKLGTYHFYMEMNLPLEDLTLLEDTYMVLTERYNIKILGIYIQ